MQEERGKFAAGRARVLALDPKLADDPPTRSQPREMLQRARVLPEAARAAIQARTAGEGKGQRRGKRYLRLGTWRGRFRKYG